MNRNMEGTGEYHILDQMRQWVNEAVDKNHENDIAQFKKGTQQQLTYSTKNGRIRKLIARIIDFFSKKDYFDEKRIGHSKRQKQVADLFHQQIRDALKEAQVTEYFFDDRKDKLTREYVKGKLERAGLLKNNWLEPQMRPEMMKPYEIFPQLDRNENVFPGVDQFNIAANHNQFNAGGFQMQNEFPQNEILGVFGNSAFDKNKSATFDFKTDLQTFADINIGDMNEDQIVALKNLYENWQSSIEGAEKISEDNRRHILGNLISNSKPLLQSIIERPERADQYLGKNQEMANKLSAFVTKNVSDHTTFEQTSQDAFDLMSEFTQFASIYGNNLQQKEARPSLGDCILFPVLQVATELGNDFDFQAHSAGGNTNVVNSLFLIADRFAAAKTRNEVHCGERITIENFNDKSFDLAISFEPIRCFFNLVGAPNVVNQYQDANLAVADDENNFATKANDFVNRNSYRKSNLQWQAENKTISQNIDTDLHLQNSFKASIGISWDSLNQEQKGNVKRILDSICTDAFLTGKDVERHLEDMKPLIVKIMDDGLFIGQYLKTMKVVTDSMSNICLNKGVSGNEFMRVADEYFGNIAKPLLELNNQLDKKIHLDTLSLYAVNSAVNNCFSRNSDVALKYVNELSSDSMLPHLALLTQAMQRKQFNLPVAAGIDKFARDQVLDTGPLCQFALQMNKLAPTFRQSTALIPIPENAKWLKSGPMDIEDYEQMTNIDGASLEQLRKAWNYIQKRIDVICRKDVVPANTNVIRTDLQQQPGNAANQIENKIEPQRDLPQNKNIVQNVNLQNMTTQAGSSDHLNIMTDKNFVDILNFLGATPHTFSQEQKAAVNLFAYLFIDDRNNVSEEAVKMNSQFLNALFAAPTLSVSLGTKIDELGKNISALASSKTEREFTDYLSLCAFNLNMIKVVCENSGATGQLNFEKIIFGITSVVATRASPDLFRNFATGIDNSQELQSVLAAMIDLRFDLEKGFLEDFAVVPEYASVSSFLPIISKAYMHRDNDANGLGVKILNSKNKADIRSLYSTDQRENEFNETKRKLFAAMEVSYGNVEMYRKNLQEEKQKKFKFQTQ